MAILRPLRGSPNIASQRLLTGAQKAPAKKAVTESKLQNTPPQDQVQLQGSSPEKSSTPSSAPKVVSQRTTSPSAEAQVQAPSPEASPKILLAEEPTTSSEVDQETTNWVLESVASTPYANDPSMEIVKRRFGTLNGAVRDSLTEPLLDAITNSDVKLGSQKLKQLADTANWAQKFKKDAARAVKEGGFEAMSKAAESKEKKSSKAETMLDGILKSENMRFSSELAPSRAKEANQLLQQFKNGNENPGIHTKALGKGISYLRGRKGTRIFFKKQGGSVQWLAVCDKKTEPKAIKLLQKEFQLS